MEVILIVSSIDNGGSGPLVVFWTIFWYILAQQGENLAWEPRFCTRATLAHFWRPPTRAVLDHLDHFLVHFGATGGAFGLGAPFLYQGRLWRTWTKKWSILAQQGEPLAWEHRFCTRAPPIVYTRATLAHTPSRPSPILGRLWRTPQVAHRLY